MRLTTLFFILIFTLLGFSPNEVWAEMPSGRLIEAIICTNSYAGSKTAKNEHCPSIQVSQAIITDVNDYYGTAYTTKDTSKNARLLRQVIALWLNRWGTEKRLQRLPTDEDFVRIWRGGPNGWKQKHTKLYWIEVKKRLPHVLPLMDSFETPKRKTSAEISACAFDAEVKEAAKTADLPAQVVVAIMHAESSCDPAKRGPGDARGLFQFEEDTWKRFSDLPFQKAFDPHENIKAGITYLTAAQSTEPKVLASWHNAGTRRWWKLSKKWTMQHPNRIYRKIYQGKIT